MQFFYAMLQNDTTNSDWNSADDTNCSADDANNTVEKSAASQKSD